MYVFQRKKEITKKDEVAVEREKNENQHSAQTITKDRQEREKRER